MHFMHSYPQLKHKKEISGCWDHTEIFLATCSLSFSDNSRNALPSMIVGSVASASEASIPHSKAMALAV